MAEVGTLRQISIPATRCVTVEQAKAHLRVDHDLEDDDIALKLDAAIAACADFASRAFDQAQYLLTLDCWPACRFIDIPIAPVVAVATLSYLDADEVSQTVDAAYWYWQATPSGARLYFKRDFTAPALADRQGTITVALEAGYDPPDYSEGEDPELKLPAQAKAAILLTVGHLYANREDVIVGKGAVELPRGAKSFLDQIRIYR